MLSFIYFSLHLTFDIKCQSMNDQELLDYYSSFCEQAIWLQKIMHANTKEVITIKEIAGMLIAERKRILSHFPREKRMRLKREFNKIATSYYSKVSHWSKEQKITIDLV